MFSFPNYKLLFALRKWKLTLFRIFNEIFAPPKTKLAIRFLVLQNFEQAEIFSKGDLIFLRITEAIKAK